MNILGCPSCGTGEIAFQDWKPPECFKCGQILVTQTRKDTSAERNDDAVEIFWIDLANMTADRNRHRARVKQLEDLLHELADEVRAQRSTAAYQLSHGQQATSGRRRIDLESYLARAGIEVYP